MGYIRFLKPDAPSQKKNYKPFGHRIKKWRYLCLFQGLAILSLLGHYTLKLF